MNGALGERNVNPQRPKPGARGRDVQQPSIGDVALGGEASGYSEERNGGDCGGCVFHGVPFVTGVIA